MIYVVALKYPDVQDVADEFPAAVDGGDRPRQPCDREGGDMRQPLSVAPGFWRLGVILACVPAWIGQAGEDGRQAVFTQGRATAVLAALFHYDASEVKGRESWNAGAESAIASLSPRRAVLAPERGKVREFARSLISEGGYFPKEIYQLLGYGDVAAARAVRVIRQLDNLAGAGGGVPAPWEAAGRVGRSGLIGSSDHWAMAAGPAGESLPTSPGTLAYLPVLVVAYAAYPADGGEAAAQLAVLKDDDLRAGPAARAAAALLFHILSGSRHDKDAWIVAAAADSRDAETGRDVKSVRVKDWRYLRGEECAMGRLERAVHVWYKSESYETAMAAGTENLRSSESLAYLAALAAATYGMEGLPRRVIAAGAADRSLVELVNDLYDLANSEAVIRVAPEGE